ECIHCRTCSRRARRPTARPAAAPASGSRRPAARRTATREKRERSTPSSLRPRRDRHRAAQDPRWRRDRPLPPPRDRRATRLAHANRNASLFFLQWLARGERRHRIVLSSAQPQQPSNLKNRLAPRALPSVAFPRGVLLPRELDIAPIRRPAQQLVLEHMDGLGDLVAVEFVQHLKLEELAGR